jgi:8-oxo-dGTP pyrophosphatase MutT (NUDIX family)
MQQEVTIRKIDGNLIIRDTGKRACLSAGLKKRINDHWMDLKSQGKSFHKGDIYRVSRIVDEGKDVLIDVELTDYAHYLFTTHNRIIGAEACRVVYAAALLETCDKKYVFGEMAEYTASPGRLQCAGGGIDTKDCKGSFIDIECNIRREVYEETGINTSDIDIVADFKPHSLKIGGDHDFIAIIYYARLRIDESRFKKIYEQHIDKVRSEGDVPEFKSLVFIPGSRDSCKRFAKADKRTKVDYLIPLLISVGSAG